MNPTELQEWERAFSSTRLQPYVAARGNLAKGVALYTLNLRLCQSLYPTLHTAEITLRNAVHRALSGAHGARWYSNNAQFPLRPHERQDVTDALARLRRTNKNITPGRMVAELNLGFWTNLFDRHYEVAFWTPHAKTVFPYAWPGDRVRRQVHQDVKGIRDLRNRISHHEPIWNDQTLVDVYGNAHRIVAWVSPSVARWLSSIDDFPEVYDQLRQL